MGYLDDGLSLADAFRRQEEFMKLLKKKKKMGKWPVDLKTKKGQKVVKEVLFCMIEELMEASFTLKNKAHRITDDKKVDFKHYREELGDAFAFFMEVCIFSGISARDLVSEFERKNAIVKKRLEDGY